MALYVHLSKMTREGATKLREINSGYSKWRSFTESLGSKLLCTLACFGEYDFVVVADHTNEAAALKSAGYAAALGDVQVQTLPACQIEEFVRMMGELPR